MSACAVDTHGLLATGMPAVAVAVGVCVNSYKCVVDCEYCSLLRGSCNFTPLNAALFKCCNVIPEM